MRTVTTLFLTIVGLIVAEAVNCFLKAIEIHTDMVRYFLCKYSISYASRHSAIFSYCAVIDFQYVTMICIYLLCVCVHIVIEYYTAKHMHTVGTKFEPVGHYQT